MEEKKLNSLNIDGLGTHTGGEFDRVTISGKGRITSDLNCLSLDISGMCTLEGNVVGENVRASGMGKFLKKIAADEIDISGKIDCEGEIETKKLYVEGLFKAKQCLKTIKAEITGMMSVEGDMIGESIVCDGMFKCGGFLNCETLDINIRCASKLNEVGATRVKITASPNRFNTMMNFLLPDFLTNNKVTAQVIESDEIDIESCEVKVLRGKDIKIGPKCKVGLVEYSGTLEVDSTSEVDQVNKM